MPWQQIEHRIFTGGENVADSRRVLREDEAVLLENVILNGRGQAEKRKGMTAMPGSVQHPARVDVLATFYRDASTRLWMVVSNGQIRLHDGTVLLSGVGTGPYGWAVFAGKWLLVDGQNYYESDGTAAGTRAVPLPTDTGATLAEVRRCRLLLTVRDRVYAVGDPQVPHAVYYSQPGRHDYFKQGDMRLLVGQHDGLPIVLMVEAWGGIIVGKPTGFWRIVGDPVNPSALRIERLTTENGPTERCFAFDGEALWYVSQKRVYALVQSESNVWSVVPAGRQYWPLHAEGDWSRAVAAYYDGRVHFFFRHPSVQATGNNFASVADTRFRSPVQGQFAAWTRFVGWRVSAAAVDQGALWAGLEDGRLVRLYDGSTDLGVPIRMRLWTFEYPLGDTFALKMFDGVNVEAAQTGTRPVRFIHEATVGLYRQQNQWTEAFVAYSADSQADWQQSALGAYLRDLQDRTLSSL